jgi:biofilm PGA synthesis N-glycosyltransferase PgaC
MLFVLGLFVVDYIRKVKPGETVPLTFIVPCYNDATTVADTIDAIYASYPHEKITLYVINDKSTDNSSAIISAKQQQYGFVFLQNDINKGKVATINETIDRVQTAHFLVVDADTHITAKAIYDML